MSERTHVRVRFTRQVPTIHLAKHGVFEGERRVATLCGQTALAVADESSERVCVTCERRKANDE